MDIKTIGLWYYTQIEATRGPAEALAELQEDIGSKSPLCIDPPQRVPLKKRESRPDDTTNTIPVWRVYIPDIAARGYDPRMPARQDYTPRIITALTADPDHASTAMLRAILHPHQHHDFGPLSDSTEWPFITAPPQSLIVVGNWRNNTAHYFQVTDDNRPQDQQPARPNENGPKTGIRRFLPSWRFGKPR